MQLPIDASKAPYRQKYLDETFVLAPWFIFGASGEGVDISYADGDIITRIDQNKAERIIAARDAFLASVSEILSLE